NNIMRDISENKIENNIILPTTLSNLNLPDNQSITIDVTSDVVVASYPKGFYDYINKFPIVKSGIIASAWGAYFNGQPLFQIDAQLFPGSSGGLVISKPTNIAMIDGHINYSQSKQFVLLGVYSGEYTWKKESEINGKKDLIDMSYGLGNVWYSNLIPEIITNGASYSV
ncbi:MAG: serine protease, partial [Lachnospiraceae bacterium]|nr:serine protease [Lachnospiraceae bacterium]